MNFSQDFDTLAQSYQDLRRQVNEIDGPLMLAIQNILNKTRENKRNFNKIYRYETFQGAPYWRNFDGVSSIEYFDSDKVKAEVSGEEGYREIIDFPIALIRDYFTDKTKYDQYFTDMYNSAIVAHENKLKKQLEDQLAKERAEFMRLQAKFKE